jgi:3-oxoacyl-[acyl-carrier-protein] synthase I
VIDRRGKVAPAAITAIGMITPAGHGAEASCAALRAGLTRFSELPSVTLPDDDGEPAKVIGAAVTGITCGTRGLGRFTRLAADGLRDLAHAARASGASAALAGASLYLALPEPDRAPDGDRIARELGARVERFTGFRGLAGRSRVFPRGGAGFVEALAAALADLARGEVALAAVGGVDSLVEPEVVRRLNAEQRLKGPGCRVGLIPGEGAGFVMLEPRARVEARGARPLAMVEAAATAVEPTTLASGAPCDGAGLFAAMQPALARAAASGEAAILLLTDLDGEPYRSEELGYALTRARQVSSRRFRITHIADTIGEAGAASPAISLVAGARALAHGYAREREAILLASSLGGLRGAAYLAAPEASPHGRGGR